MGGDLSSDFVIIGITPSVIIPDESTRIINFLSSGKVAFMHIRHPEADVEEISRLLTQIPAQYLSRITLHDHFNLAKQFQIGGLHLNSRNPDAPYFSEERNLRISRSCHSLREISEYSSFDYVTLSPIFDSISKQGYRTSFPEEKLQELSAFLKESTISVIALGGITPTRFPLLRQLGFKGAAMLGALWQ